MKGSMYISLLPDPGTANTPNIGLMLGAAALALIVAAVAIPGLFAGLHAALDGRWLWPAGGLLVWIGLIVLSAKLAQSYDSQVERMTIAPLTTFSNGLAEVIYAAAIIAGMLFGWRIFSSLRTRY
ncbi:hypothetical protein [Oerskovia paurometabola]|uniref:hypothetical protein n=1 Tax=Oerskovia paurometabola TaxID=162170 RepID=UPI00381F113B